MNQKQSHKIAVIGCGRIAGHHCRTIQQIKNLELTAVCDLNIDRATAYGNECKVPSYTNYRTMIASHPEIETVVIATPSGMHFEHGMEMIENYKKNIIIEKPTFLRPSEVRKAWNTATKVGVKIFPVFQNRFNSAVQRVKTGISNGELGAIRVASVRVRWCRPQRYYDLAPWRGTFAQDGGALTNQGIHHIDLLRYLGGEVSEVSAVMRTLGANIEVEDTVVGSIQFESGAVGALEITTAARPDDFEASLSLVCENGLAQIGGIAVNELQVYTPNPSQCREFSQDFSGNVYGLGHAELYRSIANTLGNNVPYIIAEDDCWRSINLLHSFYVSAHGGSAVKTKDHPEYQRLGECNETLAALYRIKDSGRSV